MTAPKYTDQKKVGGITRDDLRRVIQNYGHADFIDSKFIVKIAKAGLLTWMARDLARETAALQDEAIHKALPRTHAMEKCVKVLRWFATANEENHMGHCFWCSAPLENFTKGHADPCGVVDAKKVLTELDKTKV